MLHYFTSTLATGYIAFHLVSRLKIEENSYPCTCIGHLYLSLHLFRLSKIFAKVVRIVANCSCDNSILHSYESTTFSSALSQKIYVYAHSVELYGFIVHWFFWVACNAGVFRGRASSRISVNRSLLSNLPLLLKSKMAAIASARPNNTPAFVTATV